jgi:hypothetical protein
MTRQSCENYKQEREGDSQQHEQASAAHKRFAEVVEIIGHYYHSSVDELQESGVLLRDELISNWRARSDDKATSTKRIPFRYQRNWASVDIFSQLQ